MSKSCPGFQKYSHRPHLRRETVGTACRQGQTVVPVYGRFMRVSVLMPFL